MVTPVSWLRWMVLLPALGTLFHVFLGERAKGAVKVVGPGVLLAAFAVAVAGALLEPADQQQLGEQLAPQLAVDAARHRLGGRHDWTSVTSASARGRPR